jgi:hypothetical protein
MKPSREKLVGGQAVNAPGAATVQVIGHQVIGHQVIGPQAGGASVTRIELVAAMISKMEAAASTTAKVEPGAEVEVAGALAQVDDQVVADVPPANVYVTERFL